MAPWLAVLAMLELSPPVLGPPGEERPPPDVVRGGRTEGTLLGAVLRADLGLAPAEAERAWVSPLSPGPLDDGRAPRLAPPSCSGDLCQPRVSVPGMEPRFDARGKRTELVLLALDRAHVEPLASLAWALTATGLRLDYTPPQFAGGLATGHAGWGRMALLLRWRIDANNAPVWPVRTH
jgi:hypothetical protein